MTIFHPIDEAQQWSLTPKLDPHDQLFRDPYLDLIGSMDPNLARLLSLMPGRVYHYDGTEPEDLHDPSTPLAVLEEYDRLGPVEFSIKHRLYGKGVVAKVVRRDLEAARGRQ